MTPTVLNFPSVANPARITWQLNRLDTRFKSPLSGTFQDIQRPGANWVCDMSWGVLSYADSQQLAAWSDQMSQAGVRTYLPNFIYIPQGSIKGVVIVNGANQTGTSLVCNQAPVGTNLVVAGDFIVITSGTHTQLLRITKNSSSDGAGNITLNFTPAMRFSPANGSQIFFGVTPTTAPAVYKSDWQGNQLQYSTPRTNLIDASNNFTASTWGNSNCTVTASSTTGPDGVSGSATKLAVANVSNPNIQDNSYTVPATPPASLSAEVWIKAGNITQCVLNSYQDSVGGVPANFSILSGPGSVSGSGTFQGTVTGLSPTQWTRVGFTTTGALTAGFQYNFYIKPQAATITLGDYIYVFGAQLEIGSVNTSYIPTTTAPVTVTDYTLAGNQLTFASAPANASTLTWTDGAGVIFNLPSGNGSTTVFYMGLPVVAFAFAKPSSSFTYTAPRIAALSLALEEDINV